MKCSAQLQAYAYDLKIQMVKVDRSPTGYYSFKGVICLAEMTSQSRTALLKCLQCQDKQPPEHGSISRNLSCSHFDLLEVELSQLTDQLRASGIPLVNSCPILFSAYHSQELLKALLASRTQCPLIHPYAVLGTKMSP